jgi:hypothetical protein
MTARGSEATDVPIHCKGPFGSGAVGLVFRRASHAQKAAIRVITRSGSRTALGPVAAPLVTLAKSVLRELSPGEGSVRVASLRDGTPADRWQDEPDCGTYRRCAAVDIACHQECHDDE